MIMTKKELAESKLNKSFTDARMGKITEKEFHKNYKAILKWAEKYGIPHSKEKRMDGKVKDGGRTPFKFFKDIYNSSIKEFYSFQELHSRIRNVCIHRSLLLQPVFENLRTALSNEILC